MFFTIRNCWPEIGWNRWDWNHPPIWGYHWGYHIRVSFRGLYSPKISDSANVVSGKLAHIAVAITTPAADYASISWTARWLNSFNRVKWEWNSNHFTTSLGSTLTGSLGSRILCCGPYAKMVPLIPSITSPELRGSPLLQPGNIKHHSQTHHFWLVVYLPLWKIWVRHLEWFFPIYGKIKFMFQTTNQILNQQFSAMEKSDVSGIFWACFWWLQPAPEAPRPPNIFNHRLGHDLEDLLLGRFPMFFLLEHPIYLGMGLCIYYIIYIIIYLFIHLLIYMLYIYMHHPILKTGPLFPLRFTDYRSSGFRVRSCEIFMGSMPSKRNL